jgi:Tfp pilus assembly protein PilX
MRHFKRTGCPRDSKERGIALITALILLLLLTGLGVAMTLSVNSDMLINGYYRNFRGSFYAADSGLNIARQEIYNRLAAAVPTTFSDSTQPIAPGTEATVQGYINSTYGAGFTSLTSGVGNSWPSKYQVNLDRLTLASCATIGGDTGSTCAAPLETTSPITGYVYQYNYHMTSTGQAKAGQKTTVAEAGTLKITAMLAPASDTKMSFAAWGMFIDESPVCDGSYLVPGTISGPVFTNGGWTFSDQGQYIFTDSVGSAAAKAGYQFSNGTCLQNSGTSATKGKTTIAPTFAVQPNWGKPAVPLPDNDFNQKQAVLDGKGMGPGGVPAKNPTSSDLHKELLDVNKTPYPTSGASKGVFLPYEYNTTTNQYEFTGGGIYVEGDASVVVSPTGSTGQVYTINQGGTITTVTVDNAANSTIISSGTNTVTIAGVPKQLNPDSGSVINNATILYVNGNITSLAGPGQGQPAIQDDTALTITAAKNITVTGDILYKTEPVTVTQNQIVPDATSPCCNGMPADTLIPGHDKGQTLGIFTATGDIQLNNKQSNGNLQIDASMASISSNGSGGLVNVGKSINKLTIVGGRIQNTIKNIGATTRNVFFDRRYSQGGFSPPWFPSTSVTSAGLDSATLSAQFSRTQWVNQTSY